MKGDESHAAYNSLAVGIFNTGTCVTFHVYTYSKHLFSNLRIYS